MNRRDRRRTLSVWGFWGRKNPKIFFAVLCLPASLDLFGQAGVLSGSFFNTLLEETQNSDDAKDNNEYTGDLVDQA